MADVKISALPLAGTIVPATNQLPIVNGGNTTQTTPAAITTAALNATAVTVAQGGTGATTAATARSNLSAAVSGANGDITSLTGLTTPLSAGQGGTGLSALGTGVATFLGTPSSANLASAVTDETGTGALVFANTPTLVTPVLGAATATSITFPANASVATFGDTPVSNYWYCDPDRGDTYTENGSQARPYKDLQDAIDAANAAIAIVASPQFVVLQGGYTGNISLTKGDVWLVGEFGSIHNPIVINGTITVQATGGTLLGNHFSIQGVEIIGGANNKCINMTGTAPQKLYLQDVWLYASGDAGSGLYQDNTGSGSFSHGSNIKVTHGGSGDVYCFDIRGGYADFSNVETSGATQVGAARSGAGLYFTNSELDANGPIVIEAYGTGTVSVANCILTNAQADSSGIWLHSGTSTALVFNSSFQIPVGTGKVVLDSGPGGNLAYTGLNLYPGYNTSLSATLDFAPITQYSGISIVPSVVTAPLTYTLLTTVYTPAVLGMGARAFCAGCGTATFGDAITSGANLVPVYSDGTNWRVG